MGFLTYLLVSIGAFLGLFAGAALAFIAPEELDIGRKYFRYMRQIFFSIIIFSFGYFYGKQSIMTALLFVTLGLLFVFFANKRFFYPALGVLFYGSNIDALLFQVTSVCIFLIGLPVGTMFAEEHQKMERSEILKKLLWYYCIFFVIALPLYFFRF